MRRRCVQDRFQAGVLSAEISASQLPPTPAPKPRASRVKPTPKKVVAKQPDAEPEAGPAPASPQKRRLPSVRFQCLLPASGQMFIHSLLQPG